MLMPAPPSLVFFSALSTLAWGAILLGGILAITAIVLLLLHSKSAPSPSTVVSATAPSSSAASSPEASSSESAAPESAAPESAAPESAASKAAARETSRSTPTYSEDSALEEMRRLRDRIETLVTEQQHAGETQRQRLAQKISAVEEQTGEQRVLIDGLRGEIRHEARRRDAEMEELRTQIAHLAEQANLPNPSALSLPPAEDEAASPPALPAETRGSTESGRKPPVVSENTAHTHDPYTQTKASASEETEENDAIAFEEVLFEDVSFEEMSFEDDATEPFDSEEPKAAATDTLSSASASSSSEAPDDEGDLFEFEEAFAQDLGDPEPPSPQATPPQTDQPSPPSFSAFDENTLGATASFGDGAAPPQSDRATSAETPSAETPSAETPSFAPVAPSSDEEDTPPVYLGKSEFLGDLDDDAPSTNESPFGIDELEQFANNTFTGTPLPPDDDEAAGHESPDDLQAPTDPTDTPADSALPTQSEAENPSEPVSPEAPSATPTSLSTPTGSVPYERVAPPESPSAPPESEQAETLSTPTASDAPPEATDVSTDGTPSHVPPNADDLTVLSDLTEDMQNQLYRMGIYALDDIARWGRGEARRISTELDISEETIMNRWVFEAQAALFDKHNQMLTGM